MGKLRVYCLKALKKLSIYPLGNTPSAPSVSRPSVGFCLLPTKLKKSVSTSFHLRHPILQAPDSLRRVIRLPVQPLQFHVGSILVPTNLGLRQITKPTGLVEDDGAQGTGVFHGQLQCRVGLLFARVVTDHAPSKGSALVGIEVMTAEFAMSDPANRMNKVGPVKILKPVLIRVVGVGTTIEVVRRRVLPTFLVTCIL